MRVLHVTQPTDGGVGRSVRALAQHQRDLGWDVAVASPDDRALRSRLNAAGVQHRLWQAKRSPRPGTAKEMLVLASIVRDTQPDLVHLHSAKAGLVGRLVVRGRRPTIFQPHAWSFDAVGGVLRRCTLAWERVATRWTEAVVCVSDDERSQGLDHGIRGSFHVIPNGVDLEEFRVPSPAQRQQARQVAGLRDEQLLTICVGRLTRQKGQDVLLTAWGQVRGAIPDAVLVLVGDGPDRDRLAARAGSDVVFPGEVADVRPWLDAADLVVAPSRWEGLSLALLEAMATGLSVVATQVNGAQALLPGAGAVVPIEDPDALAAELILRLSEPTHRSKEGRAARARVMADFDLAGQVQAVADLSTAVVNAGRGPKTALPQARSRHDGTRQGELGG